MSPTRGKAARAASRRTIFLAVISLLLGAVATTEDVPAVPTTAATAPAPDVPDITPGEPITFDATAYCRARRTSLGARSRVGIAAADADLLPMGSVIRIARSSGYDGIYTVMHDRPSLQGRAIDLFLKDCGEARAFGQQEVDLEILRLGWQPRVDS